MMGLTDAEGGEVPRGEEERDDVDFFENRRWRDGFLSFFVRFAKDRAEESGPTSGERERFGRERIGMERRFSICGSSMSAWDISNSEDGNCTGPVIGIGLLMTGLRGDSPIGEDSTMMGLEVVCCFCTFKPSSPGR